MKSIGPTLLMSIFINNKVFCLQLSDQNERRFVDELSVFDHFVGLVLKGLK